MIELNNVLVSVIMPVYNAREFILDAVMSVQAQTHSNLEIIIINDGSDDDTEDVIKNVVANDQRVTLLSQRNQGVSNARNLGLRRMKGDFFCFLDADDIMTPNSLKARLMEFADDESLWFVDGAVEIVDMDSQLVLRKFMPRLKGNPFKELLLLSDSCFCGQTWLIKRDPIFNYKFNEQLSHGEDLSFFIELSKHYKSYSFTNEVILKYNRHSNSAMENLEGLEMFYSFHLNRCASLRKKDVISSEEFRIVKSRIRRIMTRSYLKKGNIFKVIKWM